MDFLDRFAETLEPSAVETLAHIRDFIAWQSHREGSFVPTEYDDIPARTYLLELKTGGMSSADQRSRIAALRRFYAWSVGEGLLSEDPLQIFSVERPRLTREQIRRRRETLTGTAEERQIARLRILNQLFDQLNRSTDVQTALSTALESIVSLLDLRTGWAFLLPHATEPALQPSQIARGDFRLCAACALPPGLEADNRYFLNNAKHCHCTATLAAGRMQRAVNIVECTRLQESAEAAGDNQGLMFHASVPIIGSGGPLGIINVATEEWQFLTGADLQLLSAIGAQVATAIERARLYDLANTQRLRLEQELALAREMQESLIPEQLPPIPGFSIAADWRSALEMAGDFYDVFQLSDRHWGLVVADVSDKGAAAAMYMAMTRSLLRASAASQISPAAAIQEVNARLIAHSTSDMFVTVFYGVLDAQSRELTYANAGQNPPLHRRGSGALEQLMPTGPALGIFDELSLAEQVITLAPSDALVIYTDGLTDALNRQGEAYGLNRLVTATLSGPIGNASLLLSYLVADLDAFRQERPLFDDLTLLSLLGTFPDSATSSSQGEFTG